MDMPNDAKGVDPLGLSPRGPLPELRNPRHFARDVLQTAKAHGTSPLAFMHRAFAHHAPGNRLAHRIT